MTATTETGRTLGDGRYRLERLLGTGGMGAVWLAHDERLDRDVAVKELSGPLAADPRYVVRFRREAQVAGALSHPNLVRVFDFALDGDRPFLVMEHVGGGTLAERLRDGRGAGDCRTLAQQLLEALAHIHAADLVHRDLRPANVLVGTDGRPRVTGFGTVLPADAAARASRGGAPIGPAARYAAPEVRAGEGASPASDLYALGVLLAECTGGDGPAVLERLVERLTAEDPADRPAGAPAALDELAAGTPTPASAAAIRRVVADRTAPAPPATTKPSHPRRPRRIVGAALAVTTAVAAAAVLTAGGGDPAPPPRDAPAEVRRGGSEVDRSLDRLEGIVRRAQERR